MVHARLYAAEFGGSVQCFAAALWGIHMRLHTLTELLLAAGCMAGNHTVFVNFSAHRATYNTTTTLQVVTSPLLDRVLPNGKPNPIYDAAWGSLAELQSQHTRFQPWFPYPRKAVAELQPPDAKGTHWDFTSMLPQLEAFTNATAGRAVNLNIGTHPCWLFTNWFGGDFNCTPPASEADFQYGTNGKRTHLKDKSADTLADYFARVFAFLSTGRFVDELGVEHTGGPALNISRFGESGSTWEVFNEAEHGYTKELYTHDYDRIVRAMEAQVGEENLPTLIGIGGCMTGFWAWWMHGSCTEWIPYFLNRSNHAADVRRTVPLDYVSIHYYASSSDRTRPETYTNGYFGGVDRFMESMVENVRLRDAYSPSTKLAITELGTLYADDEISGRFGIDGGLPLLYFHAAAAMYAYAAVQLAALGVDVVTHSQLIGSPARPEWGIDQQQFPSASILDWRTGHGTAKYWATKLLIEHVAPGDAMLEVRVSEGPASEVMAARTAADAYVCAEIGTWTYSGIANLTCDDADAHLSAIDFADYGTPSGVCGGYQRERSCSTSWLTGLLVRRKCLGKRSCAIDKADLPGTKIPGLGQYGPQPCPLREVSNASTALMTSFKVQARCSKGGGVGTGSLQYAGPKVHAVAFSRRAARAHGAAEAEPEERRVLLINKEATANNASLVGLGATYTSATVYAVEPNGRFSSAEGIATRRVRLSAGTVTLLLPPFAVVVLKLDE